MAVCSRCSTVNADNAALCSKCGATLAVTVPGAQPTAIKQAKARIENRNGPATAILVLGLIGFLPFYGVPFSFAGIVMASMRMGMQSKRRGQAVAGLVLSILSLVCNIILSIALTLGALGG